MTIAQEGHIYQHAHITIGVRQSACTKARESQIVHKHQIYQMRLTGACQSQTVV